MYFDFLRKFKKCIGRSEPRVVVATVFPKPWEIKNHVININCETRDSSACLLRIHRTGHAPTCSSRFCRCAIAFFQRVFCEQTSGSFNGVSDKFSDLLKPFVKPFHSARYEITAREKLSRHCCVYRLFMNVRRDRRRKAREQCRRFRHRAVTGSRGFVGGFNCLASADDRKTRGKKDALRKPQTRIIIMYNIARWRHRRVTSADRLS